MLDKIKAHMSRITDGPWTVDMELGGFIWGPNMEMCFSEDADCTILVRGFGEGLPMGANAEWVTECRNTYVPWLISEVERLEKLLAQDNQ